MSTDTDTDTIEKVDTDHRLDDGSGDHDRMSHFVRKSDQMKAAIEGTPVYALCGKKWVPNRDPDRYPVCQSCKELYEMLGG